MTDVYVENGYEDRQDYLESLADEYEVNLREVEVLADLLGEDEDFDGLVSAIEDFY